MRVPSSRWVSTRPASPLPPLSYSSQRSSLPAGGVNLLAFSRKKRVRGCIVAACQWQQYKEMHHRNAAVQQSSSSTSAEIKKFQRHMNVSLDLSLPGHQAWTY